MKSVHIFNWPIIRCVRARVYLNDGKVSAPVDVDGKRFHKMNNRFGCS